jgi:hypothetical protein
MTYMGLKQLIGSTDAPGRLQELEGILNAVPPATVGLTRLGLQQAFVKVDKLYQQVCEVSAALAERSSQVSFKSLYTSLIALQETEGDHCPACDTPLEGAFHVLTNPYEKAKEGLARLKDLSELQESLRTKQIEVATASRELRQQLADMGKFVAAQQEQDTIIGRYLADLAAEPAGDWWMNLYPVQPDPNPEAIVLEHFLVVAARVAEQDTASLLAQKERQKNIEERDCLNRFQLLVQAQTLKRQQCLSGIAEARTRIAAFDINNGELIEQVAEEKRSIESDTCIKTAYDHFLIELRNYRDQLPGSLLAGLNETAMNLYNEFNRNDLDADRLSALHLPLTGDEKIEIVFRGNPEARVDALHILSEGHIRCLGLAILLAKAKSIESPLVVFDDAINAIDHDHRGGIREAIFESDNFLQMQLIVTCHSNEFIKDIQQHLPPKRRGDCMVYLFRHHTGDYQPRVKGNVPTKNYIAKARAAKDELDDRAALASARQALEMLSEKMWRWLASYDLGLVALQLPGVGAEPSLRNLCDALFKKLSEAVTFNHVSKDPLLVAFSRILGIPAINLVWTYLNKGTHEEADRDDFDAELVEDVVLTIEELDQIDLRPRR